MGAEAKGQGQAESSSSRLRGLSWLVAEAVAEDFADHGQEYAEAARKVGFFFVRLYVYLKYTVMGTVPPCGLS